MNSVNELYAQILQVSKTGELSPITEKNLLLQKTHSDFEYSNKKNSQYFLNGAGLQGCMIWTTLLLRESEIRVLFSRREGQFV